MISNNEEKSKTQNEMVLEHLKKYGSITPLEALERYGCFRLGARIFNLRQLGYRIATYTEEKNGKKYARYFFIGEA